jgi:hypothetical protein
VAVLTLKSVPFIAGVVNIASCESCWSAPSDLTPRGGDRVVAASQGRIPDRGPHLLERRLHTHLAQLVLHEDGKVHLEAPRSRGPLGA